MQKELLRINPPKETYQRRDEAVSQHVQIPKVYQYLPWRPESCLRRTCGTYLPNAPILCGRVQLELSVSNLPFRVFVINKISLQSGGKAPVGLSLLVVP